MGLRVLNNLADIFIPSYLGRICSFANLTAQTQIPTENFTLFLPVFEWVKKFWLLEVCRFSWDWWKVVEVCKKGIGVCKELLEFTKRLLEFVERYSNWWKNYCEKVSKIFFWPSKLGRRWLIGNSWVSILATVVGWARNWVMGEEGSAY